MEMRLKILKVTLLKFSKNEYFKMITELTFLCIGVVLFFYKVFTFQIVFFTANRNSKRDQQTNNLKSQ